jgi:hypothetical protein
LSLYEPLPTQYPQGDNLLFIIPQRMNSDQKFADGGGIQTTVFRGTLKFRIIILNVLDQIQGDFNAITSTTLSLGMFSQIDKLIGLMQMYDPCYTSNSCLIEPFRIDSVGKPDRLDTNPEWVYCDIIASFAINQTIPGQI